PGHSELPDDEYVERRPELTRHLECHRHPPAWKTQHEEVGPPLVFLELASQHPTGIYAVPESSDHPPWTSVAPGRGAARPVMQNLGHGASSSWVRVHLGWGRLVFGGRGQPSAPKDQASQAADQAPPSEMDPP